MNNTRPQALVVAKAYPPVVGGVETYSEAVVRAYMRRGIVPTVMTQTKGKAGWREIDYPEGRIKIFNTGAGNQPWVFARLLWAMLGAFPRANFEFMHATTWRPALALLPFARSTPLLITVHGREVMNYPRILMRPMIELLRRADAVVTVSNATMKVAEVALHGKKANGRWGVAFNGISYPDEAKQYVRVASTAESRVRLVSLARLISRKNIQGCISALADLREEGINQFEYWIAGKGPLEHELQALVHSLHLEEHVRFLGRVPEEELTRLYQGADIFLHPQTNVGEGNDFEGFGLVIADAMSFGCAVVAGDSGGPRDFVKHNNTGLLVDGLNADELKSAIRSLIIDPALRSRLSESGRDYALSTLSWDSHVENILTLSAGGRRPKRDDPANDDQQ